MDKWTERIECPDPECEHEFDAEVIHYPGEPWPSYWVLCPKCGYEIGESEWNQVKYLQYQEMPDGEKQE